MQRLSLNLLLTAAILTPAVLFAGERLPGTDPLTLPDDVRSADLVPKYRQQVHDYFQRRIDQARDLRDKLWKPDFASVEAYEKSVAAHRVNCRKMLGLVDECAKMDQAKSEPVVESADCRVERITIPMFAGLSARGLLLSPKADRRWPVVIVCPDATTWPEQFVGLAGDVGPPAWLRDLLARGAAVYIPQSIERLTDHPYCKKIKNKDRRIILYRLGYVVGRTMPGMDVQDVVAAVDYLSKRPDVDPTRIGLVGIGQGGMTALFTAAVDRRVAAVAVVNYFQRRNRCWQEPVDRRLHGRLLEFGDAELAGLIAPRTLVILHSSGLPAAKESVASEVRRAERFYRRLNATDRLTLVSDIIAEDVTARSASSIADALALSNVQGEVNWPAVRVAPDQARTVRDRHFEERLQYVRKLIADSEVKRQQRWQLAQRPASEFEKIRTAMLDEYRKLVGEVKTDGVPLRPRAQLVLSTEKYKQYRVVLDVTDGVEVFGYLLVPHNIKGRAAAIICQHGHVGTPEMVTGLGMKKDTAYHEFGRHHAERGYVVFAPEMSSHRPPVKLTNQIVHQADAVGMMRLAMVVAKTQRIIDFLETLPFVDPQRIGFQGVSYGGYYGLWAVPLVDRVTAAVPVANFNDWRSKITTDTRGTSYLMHPDEDFYNWDILHRFTHPELIAMTAPRAVCIEFGHRDGVTSPEWTFYAWKQVVAWRDHMGLQDRIILDHFDGGHEIHGIGSFDFLDRFLRPERSVGRDGKPYITHLLNSRNKSQLSGNFWMPAGAKQLCGMAVRLKRVGRPGPLEVRFGTAPGKDDLGTARIESDSVPTELRQWQTLQIDPKPVSGGALVYYQVRSTDGQAPEDHYVVYGPKPLGGKAMPGRFGLSYRVLTGRKRG